MTAAIVTLTTLASAGTHAQASEPGVLKNALDRSGYAKFATGDEALVLRGRATFMGNDGTFEHVVEPGGAFRRTILAPLGEAFAESGESAWASDWTGMPRTLVSREREWNQMLTAVLTGAWASPGGSIDAAITDEEAEPGHLMVRLSHRQGPIVATLEVEEASGRPKRLTYDSLVGLDTWDFSGTREAGGIRVPARIEHRSGNLVNVFEVESATLEPARGAATYTTLPARPADVSFDTDAATTFEFRRAPTGHLLVQPLVDNEDIGWFIFDTGAGGSCAIDAAALDTLGMERIGETRIVSIQGRSLAPVYRAASLQLGPVTLEEPVIIGMDLSPFARHFDAPVVGIIGYDLISRCVVELDLQKDQIALHDPAAFDGESMDWQGLQLVDRHPVITARFEGHEGVFKMDAGASGGPFGNVTFHSPAVERLSLLEGRETQNIDVGVGTVDLGSVEWFELNGYRFENPRVAFANPGPGPFADQYTLGNIGVDFLKPFRVVLDYSRNRMALVAQPTP